MLKYILIISLFINLILAQQERELVRKVIDAKLALFPSMRDVVNNFFPKNIPDSSSYIHGNGFTKFAQSNDILRYEGVPHEQLNDFLNYLADLIQIQSSQKEQIVRQLALTKYAESQSLTEHNLIFSVGNADCKFSTILGVRNRDARTTDWYIADIKLKFALAPNILILQKSKSGLWGMFGSSSVEIKIIPASLTENQMSIIGMYFQLVTYQGFKDILKFRNLRFLDESK